MTDATGNAVESVASAIAAVSPIWAAVATQSGAERASAGELRTGLAHGVELIYEGSLLHFDSSRVCAGAALTENLKLLIGDWCYAAGLQLVARAGDVEAVETLALLIADIAAGAPAMTRDEREARWDTALAALR